MKRVNFYSLSKDLKVIPDEEIIDMCNVFLLYSFKCETNSFNYKDCRTATNMCIGELIKRGHDEELIVWDRD